MKRLWFLLACLSPVPFAGAERVDVEAVPELSVRPDVPEIALDPRPPGRSYVILPELSYRFQLEPRCPAGFRPASVSLGIADTQSRLAADGDGLEAELTVPAAQLAPLPLADFCELPAGPGDAGGGTGTRPAEAGGRLEVGAALSVQASLTCADGERERMTFVSTPLALTLVCNAGAGEDARD